MRVLWMSHFVPYPPTGHGALQRSHHLLKEVSRRHETHLVALCPSWTLDRPGAVDEAARALATFTAAVDVFPLPPDRLHMRRAVWLAGSLLRSVPFWERRYWSPAASAHLGRLCRSTRFDLVHVDTVYLMRYVSAIEVPVVLNHHNVESQLLRSRAASERAFWRRFLFRREASNVAARERGVAGRVAHNLVVSELDGHRLREIVPTARITTVTNGVDVEFFRPRSSLEPAPTTMVFAGSLDWFPNQEGMLFFAAEVWPRLLEDNAERRMTVIGRAPPPALLDAARDPRLRVLGFVDDVRPHLEAASIYVCPIRVGGGTRLKILDALAMARPVVSTDVGVEGIGLTEGEHYLRANTPSEFVSQIRRLEGDSHLRHRLGAAGRAFVVERYSWARVAASLEEAYAQAARST